MQGSQTVSENCLVKRLHHFQNRKGSISPLMCLPRATLIQWAQGFHLGAMIEHSFAVGLVQHQSKCAEVNKRKNLDEEGGTLGVVSAYM